MKQVTPKPPKQYTLVWDRRGVERSTAGTLEELTQYFDYTLRCGNSFKPTINTRPKTISALVRSINRSIDLIKSACYDREYVSVKEGV